MSSRSIRIVPAAVAAAALALAACSPPNENPSTESGADTSAAAPAQESDSADASESAADQELAFEGGYVKAKPAADDEDGRSMTGIFGTLVNNTDEDVTIESFTADIAGADEQPQTFEMHEVVDGQMQMKPGGFVIPAGGTHELAPGGDHMMIMDYDPAIMPGTNTITLIINTADGQTIEAAELPVRDMASGDESYGEDGELQGHSAETSDSGMNHDHDHDHGEGEHNH